MIYFSDSTLHDLIDLENHCSFVNSGDLSVRRCLAAQAKNATSLATTLAVAFHT